MTESWILPLRKHLTPGGKLSQKDFFSLFFYPFVIPGQCIYGVKTRKTFSDYCAPEVLDAQDELLEDARLTMRRCIRHAKNAAKSAPAEGEEQALLLEDETDSSLQLERKRMDKYSKTKILHSAEDTAPAETKIEPYDPFFLPNIDPNRVPEPSELVNAMISITDRWWSIRTSEAVPRINVDKNSFYSYGNRLLARFSQSDFSTVIQPVLAYYEAVIRALHPHETDQSAPETLALCQWLRSELEHSHWRDPEPAEAPPFRQAALLLLTALFRDLYLQETVAVQQALAPANQSFGFFSPGAQQPASLSIPVDMQSFLNLCQFMLNTSRYRAPEDANNLCELIEQVLHCLSTDPEKPDTIHPAFMVWLAAARKKLRSFKGTLEDLYEITPSEDSDMEEITRVLRRANNLSNRLLF